MRSSPSVMDYFVGAVVPVFALHFLPTIVMPHLPLVAHLFSIHLIDSDRSSTGMVTVDTGERPAGGPHAFHIE